MRWIGGGNKSVRPSVSVTNVDIGTGTVTVYLSRKSKANRRWQEITDRTGVEGMDRGGGGMRRMVMDKWQYSIECKLSTSGVHCCLKKGQVQVCHNCK